VLSFLIVTKKGAYLDYGWYSTPFGRRPLPESIGRNIAWEKTKKPSKQTGPVRLPAGKFQRNIDDGTSRKRIGGRSIPGRTGRMR
jgi:hypothetical protein